MKFIPIKSLRFQKCFPGGNVSADNLWDSFNTFQRLTRSFYKAARAKYDRAAILNFYSGLEKNCFLIRSQLEEEKYEWGSYKEFVVHDPKKRIIQAAPFRDRVVHQAIHEMIEPLFEPTFYYHSYACRPGRGTYATIQELQKWLKTKPHEHYLKMDVSKFFPSIDRNILFAQIKQKVADERLLKLIYRLLMDAPGTKGLPIGNLTSQLFANVYLSPLDHFIKKNLKAPYYIRYMDDIVILAASRNEVKEYQKQIEKFGHEKLDLKFAPHKIQIGSTKNGISFVGYRCFPWGLLVRGKTLARFRKKLKKPAPLDQKIKQLLAYKGHIQPVIHRDRLMNEFLRISLPGGLVENLGI